MAYARLGFSPSQLPNGEQHERKRFHLLSTFDHVPYFYFHKLFFYKLQKFDTSISNLSLKCILTLLPMIIYFISVICSVIPSNLNAHHISLCYSLCLILPQLAHSGVLPLKGCFRRIKNSIIQPGIQVKANQDVLQHSLLSYNA